MASYGTIQRPSTTSSSSTPSVPTDQPYEPKDSALKRVGDFKLIFPFNIPTTPESAAVRIIKNLGSYGVYYTLFIWLILFISLIPRRKVSLIFLTAMSYVTCLCLLLLRDCVVLQKIIDRRWLLPLLAVVTMVELVVTEAAIHLFVCLGCGIPVVLVHAVLLRPRDDVFVEEASGNVEVLVPLTKDTQNSQFVEDSV
ncbi:hypothetical protein FNV43_RR10777 [Rhamnella rubrinervis]|uniref:PRA1 family protein n=1 Tax=Rhamnella rubrinervis TaxID=2594499 RepID=A0A8K0H4J9_9ROSA|nr:hypothetical protein FNV43_RR10777 [Rhamnella rubrinervis]